MNLSTKLLDKVQEAALRFHERVDAGGDPATLREELHGAVSKWLRDHKVEAGPKFIEIIVAGAIGAAGVDFEARKSERG